ncbi:hypothetical protein LTR78_008680 [Recurvomyces mirabilis]|uniref:Uncharacterized protein n=1 Tax=Recurvomyces mirabilis TaxID=574656 RepID=A0AAE0TSW7_9PEZI|nr:hypothetical protein LTR78_008680 [Recurvomyces mirabilis]KAK5159235.1 hypothetical protein LTS14_002377 [Recurvomyces mirabilis]
MAGNMKRDQLTPSWDRGYKEARALYDADQLDEAIEAADKLLHKSGIPRYHRIKCYLLNAACTNDDLEAQELVARSNSLWHMARSIVGKSGPEPDAEEALAELRHAIDSLDNELAKEREEARDMEEEEEVEEEKSFNGYGLRRAGMRSWMVLGLRTKLWLWRRNLLLLKKSTSASTSILEKEGVDCASGGYRPEAYLS